MVYLQITLHITAANRPAAANVFLQYREPFLSSIQGALSKNLLLRDEDVQVLHGFDTSEHAQHYLQSELFNKDVVSALTPLLAAAPDIRLYQQAEF